MCDQQSLRSACAYAQSDQSLCLSLEYSISVKLLTEHLLDVLSLKGGYTCSSESTLVKMPHSWKSHTTAQLYSCCRVSVYVLSLPRSTLGRSVIYDFVITCFFHSKIKPRTIFILQLALTVSANGTIFNGSDKTILGKSHSCIMIKSYSLC